MRNVPDYLICIGSEFYTPDSFRGEAAHLGVSRRLAQIPKGLVPGQSRVYCCYEASRDGKPRKCKRCKTPIADTDAVGEQYKCRYKCSMCGHMHDRTKAKPGKILNYFIPDRLEIVLRASDQAVRTALTMANGLGLLHADIVDTDDTLKATCTVTSENAKETVEALAKMAGVSCDADLIASAVTQHGTKVVLVAREHGRGCGARKHQGKYVMATSTNKSPLIEIDPPITYTGQHFRGLKLMEASEQIDADDHIRGIRNVTLKGLTADTGVHGVLFGGN